MRTIGEAADWRHLHSIAPLCQLRPQAAEWVARFPFVDEDIASALRAEALAHAGRLRLLAGELLSILDGLRGAGVRAFLFKGPAFSQFVLGGATRECSDLDICVEPADVRKAVNQLSQLGYETALSARALESHWLLLATNELGLWHQRSGIFVEVHWRFAPPWYRAPVEAADVFATLTERDFSGRSVLWPQPAELFLIHVADGMKSGGWGLRWLADMVAVLRHAQEIDWDRVRAIAESRGALNNVRSALALAGEASDGVAQWLDCAALRLDLPVRARELADEARGSTRLLAANDEVVARLASDKARARPMEHFGWALRIADDRRRALADVAGYLSRPAIADLLLAPPTRSFGLRLRAASWARRLRRLAA